MAEPSLKREGNLRFAGVASPGFPTDALATADEVKRSMDGQGLSFIGPASLLFAMPPDSHPREWPCQVGTALIGLARPAEGIAIEDYHGLLALTLPHLGPIAEIGAVHRRLSEHARAIGYRIRPYWRVSLWRRRLADGNLMPATEVSVFLDR
jgi:hypothetical protein